MKKSSVFGVHGDEIRYSMEEIQGRKDEVLGTLRDGIRALMKKNRITVYDGRGRILDANHVEVCEMCIRDSLTRANDTLTHVEKQKNERMKEQADMEKRILEKHRRIADLTRQQRKDLSLIHI